MVTSFGNLRVMGKAWESPVGAAVADELNTRHRKTLEWKTPSAVFLEASLA
jgi:IS30 family transposase